MGRIQHFFTQIFISHVGAMHPTLGRRGPEYDPDFVSPYSLRTN
jgi:hypothetical protein